MPAFTDKYNDLEDLQVRGAKDAKKFISANYKRFSLLQLTDILGVDLDFITETLSPEQYRLIGTKKTASILILMDPDMWGANDTI